MRASVRFRLVRAADVPALVALINDAYRPVDWWLFKQLRTDASDLRERLADPQAQPIVAEHDGRIAGHLALWLRPDEAEFGLLATAVELQGRGIGTLLVEEAERRARDAGYAEIGLHCVHENGLPAYYASLGYRVTHEERGRMWGADRDWTLVQMAKALR